MIELQYLETSRQSVWRKGARMHLNGLDNLKKDALALAAKNNWYCVQIMYKNRLIIWQRNLAQ